MIVKVCGLTPRTNLSGLGELKVDWGGLIFVESSPRYVGKEIFALPSNLKSVGVFRDATFDQIVQTAEKWGFRAVQLHGSESAEDCASLQKKGFEVIKAIGVGEAENLDSLTSSYLESVDYFLFDSPGGGTGHSFDWSVLETYTGAIPFLLAGGIATGFGESVKAIMHPQFKGVDLNSRFELAPGQKDISLLNQFIEHELSR